MRTPLAEAYIAKEVWKNYDFRPIFRYIAETAKDMATVAIESKYETIPRLLNGTIFNDLEWSLTLISLFDAEYLIKEYNIQTQLVIHALLKGVISNDLE